MSNVVITGRWFTPVISRFSERKSASSSSESVKRVIVSSWQRPIVLIGVSRVTARHSVVIGFVRFSSHASGQISWMSRARPTSTGMFRNARLMPPGPTESPTLCRIP